MAEARTDIRSCDACGTPTTRPRGGLCPACFLRRPPDEVPLRGACASCHERRRMLLRWTRLPTGLVLTCHNCGHVADHARPRVRDVPMLRDLLTRERRATERRENTILVDAREKGRRKTPRRFGDRTIPA